MIHTRRDGATTKSKLAPLAAKIKLRAERAERRERPRIRNCSLDRRVLAAGDGKRKRRGAKTASSASIPYGELQTP
jgi:hypothetical protein